mgnify:CR=1 FL=1
MLDLDDEDPDILIPLNQTVFNATENDETRILSDLNINFTATDEDAGEVLTFTIAGADPINGTTRFAFTQSPTAISYTQANLTVAPNEWLDYDTITTYILYIE